MRAWLHYPETNQKAYNQKSNSYRHMQAFTQYPSTHYLFSVLLELIFVLFVEFESASGIVSIPCHSQVDILSPEYVNQIHVLQKYM